MAGVDPLWDHWVGEFHSHSSLKCQVDPVFHFKKVAFDGKHMAALPFALRCRVALRGSEMPMLQEIRKLSKQQAVALYHDFVLPRRFQS